jgi:hypothetical protein
VTKETKPRCKHIICVTYAGVARRCRNNALANGYCGHLHGGSDKPVLFDQSTEERSSDYGETEDDRAHMPDGSAYVSEGNRREKR